MSQLDTYATNKPTLFEMSDSTPGARVLDGNWGLEHMAIAIPEALMKEVQSDGLLEQIRQKAGLWGAIKAEPK
jgi:polar amino acid transport system substrate-binding protein